MTAHGRAAEYLEGALGSDEEAAFLGHLIGCAACQAALADDLQLRDREARVRERLAVTSVRRSAPPSLTSVPLAPAPPRPAVPPAAPPAPAPPDAPLVQMSPAAPPAPTPLASASAVVPIFAPAPAVPEVVPIGPRRRTARGTLALAAAVLATWVAVRPPHTEPPSLALAPTRKIETRLGHPAAAGYREYDVTRGTAGREEISPAAIAELDRRGDCRGVAAAYVLSGELVRAGDTYARCPDSVELDADRAGLAVLRGQPEEALRLADRTLVAHPDHPVALWNRALALRDLGLGFAAAEGFDQVAAHDPAWAKEARVHADALRRQLTGLRDSWQRTIDAGVAMAAGGPPIPADLARRQPARARAFLHHAIRTARTRARLDELRPLAASLDGLVGDQLARYIDQAAAELTPGRLALIDEYAAMLAARAARDEPRFRAWLDRARAAGAGDLILGALDVTGRVGDFADEATHLAAATGDPWFELAVLTARVVRARNASRFAEAAALLDEGDRRCAAGAPAFRCVQLTIERAQLENDRYHPAVARLLSARALHEATAIGEWQQRKQAAHHAGEAERFRDGFAAARAFYREYALDDGSCIARRRATAFSAEMSFDEHRIGDAHAAAADLPVCGTPPELQELVLEANLFNAGVPVRDHAALLADLATARGTAGETDRRFLDYLIARAELGYAPDAPARLRAIAAGALAHPSDTFAARAGASAAAAALVDAGGRANWSEVLAIAAEVRGIAVPRRCAVVVAGDDFQLVGAAVGPDGEVTGVHLRDMAPPSDWLAPATLRERVAGCELVDVLAASPWLGVGPLLDPAVPWRYVLGPAHAPSPGTPHRVIIADPQPPASLRLPALAPWIDAPPGAELFTGADATPERLAAVARDATILEIHAHTDRVTDSDAPALALSEGRTGWAVTAEAVREWRLDRAPVVVLADCVGAVPARYAHTSWGLPAGFLGAGASAVVASLAPIPDAAATAFFAEVVKDLEQGVPIATAVAHARSGALARDPASWTRHVVVFE